MARRWLAAVVIAGLLLGLSQQWRGAHFMSHTLWTAWLCGVTGHVVDAWMRRRRAQGNSALS
jgi:membrane-associated PAP2 superfamily phosphatase